MGRNSRKIGIEEVAREARVSMATVSRVANGSHSVTPRLRARVYKASVKLGYDLDGKNKSRIIAFILSNRAVLHPFHSAVLVGAEAYCAAHDYGLLFLPVRYNPDVPWKDLHLPQVLHRHDVIRGAIVAGTNSQNLLDFLSYKGVGFVALGNNVAGDWRKDEYSAVYFDDVEGAYGLTRHLQSLGHRHIWFVGNCRMPWFQRRFEGYTKAMQEADLPVLKNDLDSDDAEVIGFLSTKSILKSGVPVTAIFAGEDTSARGVYKALQEAGLRIPEDISVAGFNDIPDAAALNPPLTSVRVFTDQVGRQMAELVIKRIAEPEAAPQVIAIPTQLVKRESCRAIDV
ncbi:MAG TPA: LacI family DNA-binding transcriptional regulator [Candidatus Acidoferrum sp.]|nr:LacI family DNA-binding transcriptional regulator [Candidatus Acidoferrum sp.]